MAKQEVSRGEEVIVGKLKGVVVYPSLNFFLVRLEDGSEVKVSYSNIKKANGKQIGSFKIK